MGGLCEGNYLKEEGRRSRHGSVKTRATQYHCGQEKNRRAISCFAFTCRCNTATHTAGASQINGGARNDREHLGSRSHAHIFFAHLAENRRHSKYAKLYEIGSSIGGAYLFLSERGGQRWGRRQRPPRRGTMWQRRGRARQQPGAAAAALSLLNDAHHLHRENGKTAEATAGGGTRAEQNTLHAQQSTHRLLGKKASDFPSANDS